MHNSARPSKNLFFGFLSDVLSTWVSIQRLRRVNKLIQCVNAEELVEKYFLALKAFHLQQWTNPRRPKLLCWYPCLIQRLAQCSLRSSHSCPTAVAVQVMRYKKKISQRPPWTLERFHIHNEIPCDGRNSRPCLFSEFSVIWEFSRLLYANVHSKLESVKIHGISEALIDSNSERSSLEIVKS